MNLHDEQSARRILLKIFSQSLPAVNGAQCVEDYLRRHPPQEPLRVVALGKAAASMLAGAQAVCGDRIDAALLVSKYQHLDNKLLNRADKVTALEAGHPYPDANSLAAGQQLLDFLAATSPTQRLLFLISGGTSSLVEVLPAGITLAQLERMNRWLLGSGLPIDVMNHWRKAVSCIKGGRLAQYLGESPVTQLLISDVPGDDPAVIGSGLLVPPPAGAHSLVPPPEIQALLDRAPPMPAADAACFRRITTHVIADNQRLRSEASRLGQALGLRIQCNEKIDGDVLVQARQLAARLREGEAGLYIWGGECVVTLPASPGQGGRCQQLALAVAREIAGAADVTLLAAGSDGTDGPGDAAGALVDGMTCVRGQDAGLQAEQALARADAGRFLAASGDLLDTGPTGTNVMDLILGLKTPAA